MRLNFLPVASALTLGTVLSGCYTYQPPPAATEGLTFSKRVNQEGDEALRKLDVLTLDDAIKIAVINNPSYISAYHAVNAARMRYYQAWGAYSPTITSSFSIGQTQTNRNNLVNSNGTNSNTTNTSTGVTASWVVFDGLARDMEILAAEHSFDYQSQLRDDVRRKLILAVAYAYDEILLAVENKRIAVADMEFQQKNLKETQLKYQAGAVPLSDVLNFQIKVNDATSNQISADYQYEIALYALAVLMGYPEGTLPANIKFPAIDTTIQDTLTSVEVYLDTALHNRPDLAAYREQLEIAKYNMYRSYSSFSPVASVHASFGYDTALTKYPGPQSAGTFSSESYNHTYGETGRFDYGGSVEWTVFNGLQRYNTMREAQAQVAAAEFTVTENWLNVVNEVRGAYANYVQNVKQAKLYEMTLGLVVKQRDLVEEEYRAGNTELTRLNEAQLNLVEAETQLVSALVNVLKAQANLDSVTNTNFVGVDDQSKFMTLAAAKEEANAGESQILAPNTAVSQPAAAPGKTDATK
ncbi:TolC family protein [Victivallis sp. Marseille-Q1083]|uniref:TolC family protein n=1 Tax=Victivallis sp. Marseille-Q1083 TaxID=2717288 RepID=UPI00158AC039|nr:TolC family protein [Victivallis sp. Marseille-Q1083]